MGTAPFGGALYSMGASLGVAENLPLSALQDHFDEIESSAYSVSLFTDWQKQRINEVWIKSRIEPGVAFDPTPDFLVRSPRLATCTQLLNSRRRIVPSRWVCLALGTSASLTFVWALRPAPEKNCSRSTLFRDNMRLTRFSR